MVRRFGLNPDALADFKLFDGKLQKTFVDESNQDSELTSGLRTQIAGSADEGASIESDL